MPRRTRAWRRSRRPRAVTHRGRSSGQRAVMRVLLVEDEPRLSATLSMGLKAEGFVVAAVGTGLEGLHLATEDEFDVVVLDIMLPGLSGYEVLRRMRSKQ